MPAPADVLEARTAHLDAQMRQMVEGRSTPGMFALILQDGRPVHSRAVGVREAGGRRRSAQTTCSATPP